MPPRREASRRAVLSADTTRDVERHQVGLWRAMASGARLLSAAGASRAIVQLALAGIQHRGAPIGSDQERAQLARLKLGAALAAKAYPRASQLLPPPNVPMNTIEIALLVVRALEACGVRYVLGGSLASSVSGEPRATLDIDLMLDLEQPSVGCLIDALGTAFYTDADAFVRAIRDRSSTNIIHLPTATKVDMFIMGATSIEARQMDRRQRVLLTEPPGASLYVYTPEDILLQKLRWFQLGGEVSDRQWRDVLGVIAVQADHLDREYLRTSATEIGVVHLLDRALDEAD
jgi:hypothetical protein